MQTFIAEGTQRCDYQETHWGTFAKWLSRGEIGFDLW